MSRIVRVLAVAVLLAPACASAPDNRRLDRGGSHAARAARLRAPAHDERCDIRRRGPPGQRGHAPRRTAVAARRRRVRATPRSAPSAAAVARSRGCVARGLVFETEEGAAAFVAMVRRPRAPRRSSRRNAISPAGVPDGIVVFRHRPDGCCHNDVPVYLAAWQRGWSAVLSLHVGGRRANTRAFAELISSYDRAV